MLSVVQKIKRLLFWCIIKVMGHSFETGDLAGLLCRSFTKATY